MATNGRLGILWGYCEPFPMSKALPLTVARLRELAAAKTQALTPDADQPSLYAATWKSGRVTFQLRYRAGTGRGAPIRVLALGSFGEITLKQARTAAQDALGRIARGEDPAAARDQTRHARRDTLGVLVDDYFATPGKLLKATTRTEWERVWNRELSERFGGLPLPDVTYELLERVHAEYADRYSVGNRIVTLLSVVFAWAEKVQRIPRHTNPAKNIRKHKEGKRERYASRKEYLALGASFARARRGTDRDGQSFRLSSRSVDALELLALTGWREKEALHLRWDELDLQRGIASLKDTKTDFSIRVLGRSVVALLRRQIREDGSPFVFPGAKKGQPLQETTNAWRRIRADAQLVDFRLNDLRHSFASSVVNEGFSDYIAGKLIGHRRQSNVSQRYAHLSETIIRRAADHTSALIEKYLHRCDQRVFAGCGEPTPTDAAL